MNQLWSVLCLLFHRFFAIHFSGRLRRWAVRTSSTIIGDALGLTVLVQYDVGPSVSDPCGFSSGYLSVRGKKKGAYLGIDQNHEPHLIGFQPGGSFDGSGNILTF